MFVETLIDFQQRYRFDGILINLPGRPADWRTDVAGRHATGGHETLVWADGSSTTIVPDDNPQTLAAGGGPLARADYQHVDPADPATYRIAGYVWNTWHAPHLWDVPTDADLTDPAAYPQWFWRGTQRAPRWLPPFPCTPRCSRR